MTDETNVEPIGTDYQPDEPKSYLEYYGQPEYVDVQFSNRFADLYGIKHFQGRPSTMVDTIEYAFALLEEASSDTKIGGTDE